MKALTDDTGIATTGIALMVWTALIAIPFVFAILVGVIWVGTAEQASSTMARNMARAYVLSPTSAGPAAAHAASMAVWDQTACTTYAVCPPGSPIAALPATAGTCASPTITATGWAAREQVTVRVSCTLHLQLAAGVSIPHTFEAETTQVLEANRFPAP